MRTERTPSPTSSSSPYMTLRPLARGGMGSVDIAMLRKPGFRRLFAIKRLRPELVEDERAKAMLIEEGRIAGLLQHPNIVPVVDVGEDAQGPYLVMDLVPGVALGDLVRWARTAKTKLDVQLVLRLVRDAARGLHAAHELKDASGRSLDLVHRDISPQNVLVGFDGIARVTDFGIAKVLDRERETTHGLLKGKTGYMAPEQLRFETIDRRVDLFSLGVVLYEMLAGDRLYRGKDLPETARMILHAPPPDIGSVRSDVPPEIVELLFELLAKDREVRPPTAKDVENRLDAAITSLAQEHGPFDIEGFLRAELADRFEETTQWARLVEPSHKGLIDLVEAARDTPPTDATSPSDSFEPTTSIQRRPRERRPLVLGASALSLVAGLALTWFLVTRAPERTDPSIVPAVTSEIAPAPPASRTTAIEASPPPPTAQPEALTTSATPPEGVEPETEELERDEPDVASPDRTRRPRTSRGRPGVAQRERPDAGPRRRIVDQEFWEKP
ncbi:MAG: protein kinase [Deltaproteobacteria bacterium]|nr:protein kinase [Deltaproteobacteria bacterium]